MATGTREKYTEHPSIAVINGTPRLRVFEDFFIEEGLPKWRKIKVELDNEDVAKDDRKVTSDPPWNWNGNGSITGRRSKRNLLGSAKSDRRSYVSRAADRSSTNQTVRQTEKKKSWFRRMFEKFVGSENGEPVEKVFGQVKTAMLSPTNEELIKARKIVDTVEKNLRASGQYEIAERLDGNRSVLEAEVALVSAGSLKYISEEQIIQFMLKSERGVRIEFLRYYPNIMPQDVAKTKIVFDGLLVFDNYCVLYFDPGTAKFSLVKELEDDAVRAKRRDPILFGMIHGSRKLYYVADWVTQDDDITLEKLETVLGEKAYDLGQDQMIGTEVSISNALDNIIVNIQTQVDEEAQNGTLITDENMMEFVMNGTAPKRLEKELRGLGVVPISERDKKRSKKKRHHHGKDWKK